MVNQEPTNKEIMKAVVGNTEQILEAIGVFSNNVEKRFDKLEGRMGGLEDKMGGLDTRMGKLDHRMEALDSSVINYLELSDKRYLELRQTNRLIFKYLKLVVQKSKVIIDLSELEEMVK
jgi:archaellum component FlaC